MATSESMLDACPLAWIVSRLNARSEKETAGVAHEYFCGMKIIEQESGDRAGQSEGQHSFLCDALLNEKECQIYRGNQGDAAGQTIHVIEQIKSIG